MPLPATIIDPALDLSFLDYLFLDSGSKKSSGRWLGKVPDGGIPWVGKVPLGGNHTSHTTELIANKQVQETELSASLLDLKNLTHFPIFLHPMSLPMLAS